MRSMENSPPKVIRVRILLRTALGALIRLSKEIMIASNVTLRRDIASLTDTLTKINVIFAKKLVFGTADDDMFRENLNSLMEELRAFWQSKIMDMDGGRRTLRKRGRKTLKRRSSEKTLHSNAPKAHDRIRR